MIAGSQPTGGALSALLTQPAIVSVSTPWIARA
jgi:hypothetical protein